LIARGKTGLEAACKEVELAVGKALVLPTDVADHQQVEKAAQAVKEAFGPVDIWINVAMASVFSPVKEMKLEEHKRVTEVTYLGYVYGTLGSAKADAPRNKGVIVQVGSALAYRGIPLQSAYCASKHAIQGFHDSLIAELLHDKSNVKVTMCKCLSLILPSFAG
jgi:short-subunit dehydrogenase